MAITKFRDLSEISEPTVYQQDIRKKRITRCATSPVLCHPWTTVSKPRVPPDKVVVLREPRKRGLVERVDASMIWRV
ncbi:MAG: hypothetical protein KA791_08510 [Flavobacteriales bacterium]|nr:hypothetical protein [Flavobacteriales bacterium]